MLIVFSLIDISKIRTIQNFSLISAATSICIFALSIFIYGEKYTERADQFRSCYLKLQELYVSSASSVVKMKRYAQILELYQNQSDKDYDNMMFDALLRGQKLRNAEGPVTISWYKFAIVLAKRLGYIIMISAIFAIPLIAGAIWVKPNGG